MKPVSVLYNTTKNVALEFFLPICLSTFLYVKTQRHPLKLLKMVKHILVTGASSGIGLALCKLLIRDHSCYVYLGSRNVAKGETAKKTILEEVPDKAGMIEVIQIDVGSDDSVQAAAKGLRDRGNGFNIYNLPVTNISIIFWTFFRCETLCSCQQCWYWF